MNRNPKKTITLTTIDTTIIKTITTTTTTMTFTNTIIDSLFAIAAAATTASPKMAMLEEKQQPEHLLSTHCWFEEENPFGVDVPGNSTWVLRLCYLPTQRSRQTTTMTTTTTMTNDLGVFGVLLFVVLMLSFLRRQWRKKDVVGNKKKTVSFFGEEDNGVDPLPRKPYPTEIYLVEKDNQKAWNGVDMHRFDVEFAQQLAFFCHPAYHRYKTCVVAYVAQRKYNCGPINPSHTCVPSFPSTITDLRRNVSEDLFVRVVTFFDILKQRMVWFHQQQEEDAGLVWTKHNGKWVVEGEDCVNHDDFELPTAMDVDKDDDDDDDEKVPSPGSVAATCGTTWVGGRRRSARLRQQHQHEEAQPQQQQQQSEVPIVGSIIVNGRRRSARLMG